MYCFNTGICSLESQLKFLAENKVFDSHGNELQPWDCVTGSSRTKNHPQDHDTIYQLNNFHESRSKGCVSGTHLAGPKPEEPLFFSDKLWEQPLKDHRMSLRNTRRVDSCAACPGLLACILNANPKALVHDHQQESLREVS